MEEMRNSVTKEEIKKFFSYLSELSHLVSIELDNGYSSSDEYEAVQKFKKDFESLSKEISSYQNFDSDDIKSVTDRISRFLSQWGKVMIFNTVHSIVDS
ncbi:MAG: hypothetical protein U0K66_07210 [Paludibacteraceae bacterium]|nr:hypothetical protein [Paludibacteraceae bacterium]